MIHAIWVHRDGAKVDAIYTDFGWKVRLAMIAKHGGKVLLTESLTIECARAIARQKGAIHGS